jgi:hypothetical protein
MAHVIRARDEPWPLPLLRSQGADLDDKLRDALAAYDAAAADPAASADVIVPIVRAALDPHVAIHEHAAQLLAHLTAEHEAARVAVAKMSDQPNWQYRFNALLCLDASTPKSFAAELVGRLLTDSSPRVREKAAEQALQLNLEALTDALRDAASSETNDAALTAIEFSRDMLRDGYTMKPSSGGFLITVWTGTGTAGRWYSRAELESAGLDAILLALGGSASTA